MLHRVIALVVASSLFVSFFISGQPLASAQESSGLLCAEVVEGNYEATFDISVDPDGGIAAGIPVEIGLDLSHSYPYEIAGVNGYIFLHPVDSESGVSAYPVTQTEIDELNTVAEGEVVSIQSELTVPKNVPGGQYEARVVIGQFDAATALLHTINNRMVTQVTEVQVVDIDRAGIRSTGEGVAVNETAVAPGTLLRLGENERELSATAGIENTGDFPLPATMTWKLYEGVLPDPTNLLAEQTMEYKLIPGVSLTDTFTQAVETGTYVLHLVEESDDATQHSFFPIAHDNELINLGGYASVDHLGVTNDGELHGCVSYTPVMLTNDVPVPQEPILDFVFTYTGAGENQAMFDGRTVPLTTARASMGFIAEVNTTQEYTATAEVSRDGEVLDTVTVNMNCENVPSRCAEESTSNSGDSDESNNYTAAILLLIIIALAPIILAYRVITQRRTGRESESVARDIDDATERTRVRQDDDGDAFISDDENSN